MKTINDSINEIYRHCIMAQALVLSMKKEIAQIDDEEQRNTLELCYEDLYKDIDNMYDSACEMWRCMQPEYIPFSTPE